MYSDRTGLILAFHGCDLKVRDKVVNGAELQNSTNDYDWLGNGIYFWENSPARAFDYACEVMNRTNEIEAPAVLGAVIHLKHCLDLTEYKNLQILKNGYETLKISLDAERLSLPENKKLANSNEFLMRYLDCAVIEMIHKINDSTNKYDSVRGMFLEGNSPYPNAGFKEKNHVQICIRNPNCIKGYFLPRQLVNF